MGSRILQFAAPLIRILPWPCWPWPFWSIFGCYIGPLRHLHAPQGPTCGTILQPSHLGHARLVSSLVWTVHGAWCVLCALTARKPAHGHGHGHGKKAEKMNFGANKGTRATVVVLGGLCMPHGRVICTYGRSMSLNQQNVLLPAWLISRAIKRQAPSLQLAVSCKL